MADLIVPTSRTVRDLLGDYLTEWHLTQGMFAHTIGFSQKHVSQIVLGRAFLNPSTALAFEAATNIPVGVWVAVSAEAQVQALRVKQLRWLEQVGEKMEMLRATKHERSRAGRRKPNREQTS